MAGDASTQSRSGRNATACPPRTSRSCTSMSGDSNRTFGLNPAAWQILSAHSRAGLPAGSITQSAQARSQTCSASVGCEPGGGTASRIGSRRSTVWSTAVDRTSRDPEGPSYVARGPGQIRVCLVESLQDRLDVPDKDLGLHREAYPPAIGLKQLSPELVFEDRQLLRDGGVAV
jgi:hypothetical protein